MSTSFQVYANMEKLPTYAELLVNFERLLASFLLDYGVTKKVKYDVYYQSKDEMTPVSPQDPITIPKGHYLWVTTKASQGGFCIYVFENTPMYVEFWQEEYDREQSRRYKNEIEHFIQQPYHWSVTRYMGTSPLNNLAYGLFASALAELTGGLIFSDDNAWDYDRFPCKPHEFNKIYFKPESAKRELRDWASNNLKSMMKELK